MIGTAGDSKEPSMARRRKSHDPETGGPPRQVRMIDVARLAGVSAQTVSRALSRPELVTAATRQVVQRAIERLNYIPHGAARNLASRSSRTVAIIIPTLSTSVYAEEVSQVMRVLEAQGYSVLIGDSEYSLEREEHLVQSFLERRPEAIILTGTEHSPRARRLLKQSGIITVETWSLDARPLDLAVGFSNLATGLSVGRHLVARGYRAIAFVGGAAPQDFRAPARDLGLVKALKEAGHPRPPAIGLQMPLRYGDGIAGLERLLSAHPETDAVFFSADSLALNAMLEVRRRGVEVPKRMAVCGFGDYDLSDTVQPRLTTVQIPAARMGELAAQLILERIAGRKLPDRVVDVGFRLLIRDST
jgi:LacI family gluconate utilization system Gnt-I transcriptional repressor